MVFKKSFFRIGVWHSRPPRDPPPFMANTVLNFHFDYWNTSLKRKTDNPFIFWSHIALIVFVVQIQMNVFYSQPRSKFAISAFSRKKRIWSNFSPDKEDLWSVATSPPQENSFSTFVELGGGVKCRRTTFRRAFSYYLPLTFPQTASNT